MKHLQIGTCGFGRAKSKQDYTAKLPAVEIQHTFYQPPQIETLEKWRESVPDDFEFTLKAWQLITHETKSPTYRRLTKELSDQEKIDAGYFKPTPIVTEGWETTLACAKALKAKTVLFQCPASFKSLPENIANLNIFFSSIERGGLNLAWEPRGHWEPAVVKKICADLDLWHAVDPFALRTETPERCYYRLHGIGGYRHKFEDEELRDLAELIPEKNVAYVFFNNRYMAEDAFRFKTTVGR